MKCKKFVKYIFVYNTLNTHYSFSCTRIKRKKIQVVILEHTENFKLSKLKLLQDRNSLKNHTYNNKYVQNLPDDE